MKRKPYSKQVAEKYIEKNRENSDIISFQDFKDPQLKKYYFDELDQINAEGFPISSVLVDHNGKEYTYDEYQKLSAEEKKACRLLYYYLPNYHEIYIGTTGSGKTTGCIEPQIRAIARQKNKANLFITDPKGELFEHHARYLKENGYRLFILNFKNTSLSDAWNPLEEMYDKQMEASDIGKNYKVKAGYPDASLRKMSKEFEGHYFEYKGMAFASHKEFSDYVEAEKYKNYTFVSSLVNQFCSCLFPMDYETTDRMWDDGARGLLYGIVLAMLEEANKPHSGFTKKMMTLKTINDIFALFRESYERKSSADGLVKKREDFLRGKSPEATTKIATCLSTADNTRQGFLSVFQSKVEKWMQGHIFQLTGSTTIDLEDKEHPWAIFIATRDYDKSDSLIAGLFIDWVYRQSLNHFESANLKGEKVRPVRFLLDEFANIPAIPDFENKIATARSRNIWFHLYIQSYEQLDLVYGPNTANIIIDNCNEQSFLGSQSQFTKERFSKECGNKTVTSLYGEMKGESSDLVEARVLPLTLLDKIQTGTIYTKRLYTSVLKCNYIRSYQCANEGIYENFYDKKAFEDLVPINPIVPNSEERSYEPIMPYPSADKKGVKYTVAYEQTSDEDLEEPPEEPRRYEEDEDDDDEELKSIRDFLDSLEKDNEDDNK